MTQGETEPPGFELIPDITQHDYVKPRGDRDYGYTCACIEGEFDVAQKRVSHLASFSQMPLSTCQKKAGLPKR